jgi:xanthine dehydrogenase molybdopterin-binding subunit B
MGFYTTEELKYSPKGVLYSRGPEDYKIPTITEIPEEFYVTLVHSRNPIAIYSSKVRIFDSLSVGREQIGWPLTKIPRLGS